MLKTQEHNGITWIDIEAPTKDDVNTIMEQYGIHPLVADELLSPTLRARADVYDDYVYLILHFPIAASTRGPHDREIDFIVGKNFVITAHYQPINGLKEVERLFEVDTLLARKKKVGTHAGFLFFAMLEHLYGRAADAMDAATKKLTEVEEQIFSGNEHEMVEELSRVSRRLLDFKKAIRPHRQVLESFESAAQDLYGDEYAYYLHAISGEYYKISVGIENNIETLHELRLTNDSLLSTKTNDIMRILTIMAFVTFPLMLFSSIFGMNTVVLPIVGMENDFWIIVGAMTIATVGFSVYFKYKKWL